MNSKETYLKKMKDLLGEEFDEFSSSMNNILSKGLRVNLSKISVNEFLNIFNYDISSVDWCEEGFYINNSDIKLGKTPLYYAGLFYLQEPSAMLPGVALEVKENDKILDIAAAPGGKSTQIISKLSDEGLLVANDISPKRTIALAKNLVYAGGENSIVLNKKPEHLAEMFSEYFDKILIDAPCSGEGLFKKDNKHFEDDNLKYANMQKDILKEIPKMLKNDGEIVYSTCTFSPEENEKIISWFLNEFNDFYLIDIKIEGLSDGRPNWSDGNEELIKTKRAWPHKLKGEGHFIAKLKRNANKDDKVTNKFKSNISEDEIEYLDTFIKKIGIDVSKYKNFYNRLYKKDEQIYLVPFSMDFAMPNKFYKCGILLGELKKNKFVPDTEWALALNGINCKNHIDFDEKDIRITKYLKGETISGEAEDGYCLVTISGHGVGFALVNNNVLKNKYKKQWRML